MSFYKENQLMRSKQDGSKEFEIFHENIIFQIE